MQASASTSNSATPDNKKPRMIFSPHQLYTLDEYFTHNQFPKTKEREQIAAKLDISPQHVQIWFQNKRAKDRRKKKKLKEESTKKFVPKTPSFWPSNLPFNSNITDILKPADDSEISGDTSHDVPSSSSPSNSHSDLIHQDRTSFPIGLPSPDNHLSHHQQKQYPSDKSIIAQFSADLDQSVSTPVNNHPGLNESHFQRTPLNLLSPVPFPSPSQHTTATASEVANSLALLPTARQTSIPNGEMGSKSYNHFYNPASIHQQMTFHDATNNFSSLMDPILPGAAMNMSSTSESSHDDKPDDSLLLLANCAAVTPSLDAECATGLNETINSTTLQLMSKSSYTQESMSALPQSRSNGSEKNNTVSGCMNEFLHQKRSTELFVRPRLAESSCVCNPMTYSELPQQLLGHQHEFHQHLPNNAMTQSGQVDFNTDYHQASQHSAGTFGINSATTQQQNPSESSYNSNSISICSSQYQMRNYFS